MFWPRRKPNPPPPTNKLDPDTFEALKEINSPDFDIHKYIYQPHGVYAFAAQKELSKDDLSLDIGGVTGEGFSICIKKGSIAGHHLTFFHKLWNVSTHLKQFFTELYLFSHPQLLRYLQGDCIPQIINVSHHSEGKKAMAMELPHSGAWRNALPIMPDSLKRRVLDAFQRIHAQGVLHGDVALKNIVVGINDKVTIMNFGNASCLEGLDHPNISSCPWSALEREMRAVKYIIDYDGAKEKERSLRDLNVDAANCENSGPSNSEILSLALEDMERWDREATDESIQDLVYLESEWINRPLPNDGRALPKRHGDHMRGKMRASRHRKNLSSPLHLSLDIPSTAQVDGLSEASYNPSSSSSLSKRLDLRPSTASPLLEPEPATSEELADIPATIASNFLSAEPASSTASTSRNADSASSSTTARAMPSDNLSTLDLHHALRHRRREFDSELEEAFNPKRPRLDCETGEKGVTFHPDVNDNGVWATGFPLIAAWDRSPTPFPGGEWLDLEDSDTSYDGSDCGSCLTPRSFLAGVSPVAPPELPLTPGSSSIVTPLEPAVDPQRVMRPTRRWPSLPPRTVVFIDEHGKREVYQLPIAIFAAAKGFVTHEQSADRLHRFEEHPQQKENNGTQPPAGSSRPEINGYNERRIRRSRKRKISDLDDDVDD